MLVLAIFHMNQFTFLQAELLLIEVHATESGTPIIPRDSRCAYGMP